MRTRDGGREGREVDIVVITLQHTAPCTEDFLPRPKLCETIAMRRNFSTVAITHHELCAFAPAVTVQTSIKHSQAEIRFRWTAVQLSPSLIVGAIRWERAVRVGWRDEAIVACGYVSRYPQTAIDTINAIALPEVHATTPTRQQHSTVGEVVEGGHNRVRRDAPSSRSHLRGLRPAGPLIA